MNRDAFLSRSGGVYEKTPWICEGAWDAGFIRESLDLHGGLPSLLESFFEQHASAAQRLELLRSHPDLAGKLAAAKQLTVESTQEQKGAGLDQCSPEELAEFQALNGRYTEKFGFPFILAVAGYDRQGILEVFRRRMDHAYDEELKEALAQVHKIAKIRIQRECAASS
ncbi:unnamed protein product [Symbiodinium natans]|uniref:2-oxo-4-hydroxy-4-carboxy-5-ureidoimidazoline decarboxylase n=1 Tax=Symbiodinium natans TaxID=878477 RepID=A0A812PSX2_9DINO|nr:unnamed protein product [Symbiodinium natans]